MGTIRNEIDTETSLRLLRKKPATNRLYDIDVSNELRSADTINGVTSAQSTSLDKVAGSSNVTVLNPTHDSASKLQMKIGGGTDGEKYIIEVVFTTAGGDTIEVEVALEVTEAL